MLLSLIVVVMFIAALIVFIAAYFAPTLIALQRDHGRAKMIFSINTLTGWTFVGWLAALGWSLSAS
ncbi:superinfection immunity protein [Magnetovibrio sp.]|uniref:superinfection immunity protein n=1 Tax=Magnetovibrio sp. TaxID=2024836 RepID=UPI002F950F2E